MHTIYHIYLQLNLSQRNLFKMGPTSHTWFYSKIIYCYWCMNSFQIFDSISYPYFFLPYYSSFKEFFSYFPRKRCVLCHLTKTGHCFRAIILNKKQKRLCCKTLQYEKRREVIWGVTSCVEVIQTQLLIFLLPSKEFNTYYKFMSDSF